MTSRLLPLLPVFLFVFLFSPAKAAKVGAGLFPSISITPTSFDAGFIRDYRLIPAEFTITNEGRSLLYISKIQYA